MKKSKITAVLMACLIALPTTIVLSGCRNRTGTFIPRETKSAEELAQLEREQLEAEQAAYRLLAETHRVCTNAAAVLINAYCFAAEERTDSRSGADELTAFCMVTDLDRQTVTEAVSAVASEWGITGKSVAELLQNETTAVRIACQALTANGTYGTLEQLIEQSTEAMKSVSSASAGYFPMRNYYFDLIDYAAYCKFPTGAYSDIGATVKEYESVLANTRYKLEQAIE